MIIIPESCASIVFLETQLFKQAGARNAETAFQPCSLLSLVPFTEEQVEISGQGSSGQNSVKSLETLNLLGASREYGSIIPIT